MEKKMIEAMAKLPSKPLRSITILLVDDDPTCLTIVAALLKSWKYEVVTVKHAVDALCALRLKNGYFDLVVTDIHMPDMNGFQLHQIIKEEFNLPVVFMSADDKDSVIIEGLTSGAAYFIVKPVTPADLKNLWQYVVAKKAAGKGGNVVVDDVIDDQETTTSSKGRRQIVVLPPSSQNDAVNYIGSSSATANERTKRRCMSKPAAAAREKEESDSAAPKKVKVVWTNGLHNQFLQAIRTLGLDRAVPKKILEIMNVPGLTRENVASHLQKYRIFLKRFSEAGCRIQSSAERRLMSQTTTSSSSESLMFNYHGQPLQSQIPAAALDISPDPIESASSISRNALGQSHLLSNYGKSRPLLLTGTNSNNSKYDQPADNVSAHNVMDKRKGKSRLIDGSISTSTATTTTTTTTTLMKGSGGSVPMNNNSKAVASYAGFRLGSDGRGLAGFGHSRHETSNAMSTNNNNINVNGAGSSRMISKLANSGFTSDHHQVANSTRLLGSTRCGTHDQIINPNMISTIVPTYNIMLPPNPNNTMHDMNHRGNDGSDFGLMINNSIINNNDFNSTFLTDQANNGLQVQPPTMQLGAERFESANVPLSTYDFGDTSQHMVEEVANMNWDQLENCFPSAMEENTAHSILHREDEEFLRSVLGYGDNGGGGHDHINHNFGSSHSNYH